LIFCRGSPPWRSALEVLEELAILAGAVVDAVEALERLEIVRLDGQHRSKRRVASARSSRWSS